VGHEGTADCGPEGVLRVHRGRVQRVGANEAWVRLTEGAGDGLLVAVDGGVSEAEVLVLVAFITIAGVERPRQKS